MNDAGFFASIALLFIVAIGGLIGLVAWLDSTSCHNKWERSGFRVSWGLTSGCLISRDGILYIPEDNYREFGDAK